MNPDVKTMLEILSVCGVVLVHTGVLAFCAGRIREQMLLFCKRLDALEETMKNGGFAQCLLHAQRLVQLEQRVEHLEDRIQQ